MKLKAQDRKTLRECLVDQFSLKELKDLAFDLGVEYKAFTHDNVSDFSRNLILYFENRERSIDLLSAVLAERPQNGSLFADYDIPSTQTSHTQIVQIIMQETAYKKLQMILDEFVDEGLCRKSDIYVIGASSGSLYLLIGLPRRPTTILKNVENLRRLDKGLEIVSVQDYLELDRFSKDVWRYIATNYPPQIGSNFTFQPIISWQQGGQEFLSLQESESKGFSSVGSEQKESIFDSISEWSQKIKILLIGPLSEKYNIPRHHIETYFTDGVLKLGNLYYQGDFPIDAEKILYQGNPRISRSEIITSDGNIIGAVQLQKIESWLNKHLTYKSLDYIREERKRNEVSLEGNNFEEVLGNYREQDQTNEKRTDSQELAEIRAIITEIILILLSDRERAVINLTMYNGMSIKEVAQHLELAETNVRTIKSRALKKIENALREYKEFDRYFDPVIKAALG